MEIFGLSPTELMAIGSVLSSVFGGLWALVKILVFAPLDKINDNLEDMKDIMVKAEVRIERLETKEEALEDRLRFIEAKLIQQ